MLHHRRSALVYGSSALMSFALPHYASEMSTPDANAEQDCRKRSVFPAMSQHDREAVIQAPIPSESDARNIRSLLSPYYTLFIFMDRERR